MSGFPYQTLPPNPTTKKSPHHFNRHLHIPMLQYSDPHNPTGSGKLWLWPSSLGIILFLILSLTGIWRGPQRPIMMSDGDSGMGEEEEVSLLTPSSLLCTCSSRSYCWMDGGKAAKSLMTVIIIVCLTASD
ncbi:hypothetical protein NQZ68_013322 [Dissostichus eleginoides]|nr:hypothetical protein NQZ68_013322 [Dissostichus eleginoides]